MAVASLVSILAIPARAIDHDLARGLHDADTGDRPEQPSGLAVLLTCRPLLVFAVCVVLFHLSNAAMLPLVGQKLALQDKNMGTSLMSACIVAAQIVMVPFAMLVGAKADRWGHKRFFLAALLILPIRGALYTLSDNPFWLVGVQLLDGIGAGIFGAIFPVIVADLMRNTGRFNVAQGAVITAQSIGAALSTTLAGLVVVARRLQRGVHHAWRGRRDRRRRLPPRFARDPAWHLAGTGEDSGSSIGYRCRMKRPNLKD